MVPSWVLVLLCNLIAGGGVATCTLRGAWQMHRDGHPNGTSGGPLPTGIRIGRLPSFRQVVQGDQGRQPTYSNPGRQGTATCPIWAAVPVHLPCTPKGARCHSPTSDEVAQ